MKLGINGMGRIGKLSLWTHVARKRFSGIVVNLGREVGQNLTDLAQTVEKDSTYGRLTQYLHGVRGDRVIENLDEAKGTMTIDGIPVQFLRHGRNPREIGWRDHDVQLVVDCTGVFIDPTVSADSGHGALRGHQEAGARKVILSAPFKIKSQGLSMPGDAVTTVMGINEEVYDPGKHALISAASCTTTCLSFMMKPLMDHFGVDRILSASMVTVHASTSSQTVLDAVPLTGAKDLRKSRSIMNNIILTTTGAAKALRLVLPEMGDVGFMAESVRVPTTTGSLTILTVNLQSESRERPINRNDINGIYREASQGAYQGYLGYTEEQNVSSDMIGFPKAATVIEAQETHTRTAFIRLNLDRVPGLSPEILETLASLPKHILEAPVTQVVVYGWYDNELGSYANMLGDLTEHISARMV
ncbi:MAG: glyceraldehyde-3-phosphate dehydrogenase [Magnetococcales bacterium]|nr:glyceraldehyde-3-phosphate dehydrogenase [Magnetococcales bacterium]MBF0260205.1 glyceraldehyde-3-phosphate dehydrogenase [Magnetococcales bacterium]